MEVFYVEKCGRGMFCSISRSVASGISCIFLCAVTSWKTCTAWVGHRPFRCEVDVAGTQILRPVCCNPIMAEDEQRFLKLHSPNRVEQVSYRWPLVRNVSFCHSSYPEWSMKFWIVLGHGWRSHRDNRYDKVCWNPQLGHDSSPAVVTPSLFPPVLTFIACRWVCNDFSNMKLAMDKWFDDVDPSRSVCHDNDAGGRGLSHTIDCLVLCVALKACTLCVRDTTELYTKWRSSWVLLFPLCFVWSVEMFEICKFSGQGRCLQLASRNVPVRSCWSTL